MTEYRQVKWKRGDGSQQQAESPYLYLKLMETKLANL
jgi:hypothetical protein